MADVKVRISGDSGGAGGATTALKQVGDEAKKTDEALGGLGAGGAPAAGKGMTLAVAAGAALAAGLTAAAGAVVSFAKSSLQAYMEQERADKQLAAALDQLGYSSKRLTPFLKEQAEAFESNLGVSNEMVQRMQALMVRFGVAPGEINRTTAAILDYAAATGQDAEGATLQLLKAIEAGGGGLKRLGIDINETGIASKDLGLAVEALGAKFAGAADADANTLEGRMKIAGTRVDGLKKALGGFFAEIELKLGVLDKLGAAIEMITPTPAKHEAKLRELLKESEERLKSPMLASYERTFIEGQAKRLRDELAALKKAAPTAADLGLSDKATANDDADIIGASADVWKKAGEKRRALLEAQDKKRREMIEAQHKWELDNTDDHALKLFALETEQEAAVTRTETEAIEERARQRGKAHEDELAEAKRHGRELEMAMAAIGYAAGSALSAGLEAAASGGEFDITDAIFGVMQVAAGALGSMVNPIVGAVASSAVGALRAVARGENARARNTQAKREAEAAEREAMEEAAAAEQSDENRAAGQLYAHNGIWTDDFRFHEGGEIPILTMPGERVLSPQEVNRMGGRGAVDSLARGGGGMGGGIQVIVAHDAKSFQDRLGSDYGRAFSRVTRQNRGDLGTILRRLGAEV
jgi:hypothetical protein